MPYGVRQDDRAHRLRRARSSRRRAQAEDDHRRRQRVPARHRLRAHPRRLPIASARRCSRTWRTSPASSPPGVHPSPVPHSDFVTTTTHKTLRGPRGGMVLCREQYAKDLDRTVFPGVQGGPLMHIIAAKAVCFKEAAEPDVRGLPATDRRQRQAPGIGARHGRLPSGQRRHRQSPDARGRVLEGDHRQGRGSRARQGRHHCEQERDSVRQESADGRERHPRRHARGHDTRDARAGDGRRSPSCISRALQTPEDDRALGMVRAEVETLCRKFPLYPE